jgi:tyrosine-specific transport protein
MLYFHAGATSPVIFFAHWRYCTEFLERNIVMNSQKSYAFLNAVTLVAGTSIGASELGLPVALRQTGYLPALIGMAGVYCCMLASGILLARLFVVDRHRDLPTFFRKHLGTWGATIFNGSYFLLACCLLVAYWSGLQSILLDALGSTMGKIAIVLMGVAIYGLLRHRFRMLYFCNTAFTVGLLASFLLLVTMSLRPSDSQLLRRTGWMYLPQSLPLILCSFGYHQVIPMVCRQLNYDIKIINRALFTGTLFPLIFNMVILTIGFRLFSVDELSDAAQRGLPVFVLLKQHFHREIFTYVGQSFSFFAIITSLLSISMAMRGALRDVLGRHPKIQQWTEFLIITPLAFALVKPKLFFVVLGVAGGIFGNLMAGLLPVTPFLKTTYFRYRYLFLWLVFAGIFVLECINLCHAL